ncbi:MAG: N-formylglutamate amidohydrolase [Gemmatales bacterium]
MSLLFLLFALLQPPPQPLDTSKFVTIKPGTLPIIISAPHGGTVAIPGIKERQGGTEIAQFVTVRDINTDLLAQQLADALAKKLDGQPYLVVAKFSRKYIDANRPAQGAYESKEAKPIYDAYHGALEKACKEVKTKWGRGLLIDVHGQAVRADAIFRGTQNGKTTTLLTQRFGSNAIPGPKGFQGMLEAKGYAMLPPSSSNEKETKFNGGYIVQNYGSHTGYAIDAIQLEFGGHYSGKAKLPKTTEDIAEVVAEFVKRYVLEGK